MSSRRKLLQAVRELMNTVTKSHIELNQTIRHDYICGRWIHDFSKHSATIIKMNTGYLVTVFLKGRILEQLTVIALGGKLEINDCAGATPAFLYHDAEKQTLFIGRYGRFSRDHECAVDIENSDKQATAAQFKIPFDDLPGFGKKSTNTKKS